MSYVQSNREQDNNFRVEKSDVKLTDVIGLDQAKQELIEVIEAFTVKKELYNRFVDEVPRGFLFYGPPGNGKTLLAKAIAGELDYNFINISGSEFVVKYVGVGAKNVREAFDLARKNKPCIMFFDELDAVAAKRGGAGGSNKENDQALNQLLVELSKRDDDIIFIAATNRMDILDPAILRPGRLDRHIYVSNPSKEERAQLFKHYLVDTKKETIVESLDFENLARKTQGMSGASIAGICREAGMIAIREEASLITSDMILDAIERVIVGVSNKTTEFIEFERDVVAHHEVGHLLVSLLTGSNSIQKISIVPHGEALGYVLPYSEDERFIKTKEELLKSMAVYLAGAASEEVFFNHKSTGCSQDLQASSSIARDMVMRYGMSDLGFISLDNNAFFEPIVIEQVQKLVNKAYHLAIEIIKDNVPLIDDLSDKLKENDELTEGEVKEWLKEKGLEF